MAVLLFSFGGGRCTAGTCLCFDNIPIFNQSDERKVHAGFRRAFRSVRQAVLQAVAFIAPNLAHDTWRIDCTGHSLGVRACATW